MVINQHLENFLSNLTPTEAEKGTYASHRQSVEGKLQASFGVRYVYESGSFHNGTGVRYHTDLDLLASMPPASQRNDSANMLSAIRTALQEKFATSNIYIRTPSVVCEFSDGKKSKLRLVITKIK